MRGTGGRVCGGYLFAFAPVMLHVVLMLFQEINKHSCYTCYTCPASRFVMSLAVGMQGQKAYGLCTTPLCAVLVVQFFP